jgi:3-hydroxyisobutyrate dehydrogenase
MTDTFKVAFLGLGHMGGPMSANLVAAGHTVRGFDPVPAAAAAAANNGVAVFNSGPAAVAEAEVIITMLPDGDAVKRCYAEILPAAEENAVFIDSSTISV